MAESFDLNNVPRAADAVATIPTSSSEVAVRTMASDFELMGKSGGMIGQSAPQAMHVPVTLHQEAAVQQYAAPQAVSQPAAEPAPQQTSGGYGKTILITALVVLGIGGLLALGYFVIGR